jgi:N-acetyl-anhydromuramyl-L-alanine amidase AmpD
MKTVILHHSATVDHKLFNDTKSIKKYHKDVKGWKDIGYHYTIEFVNNEVVVQEGRSLSVQGAHARPWNKYCEGENCVEEITIGICIVGNFDEQEPHPEKIDELIKLLKKLQKQFGILAIYGHRDVPGVVKSCPGRLFPLDKIKGMFHKIPYTEGPHWAEKDVEELKEAGFDIEGDRLEAPCKRGEMFSMINKMRKRNEELEEFIEQIKRAFS